ncbi:MAG: methylmalonyl Co-A mutase-associated GTPase MeaB [Fimbriimonadaceae bacterium]|nr:methylmalonyl Co-A mutase-associated GTPase MeaB [Chitinophagales bacterium]
MIDFNQISAEQFTERILQGDVVYLARAITLLESLQKEHQQKAGIILQNCLPHSGNSIRVGITGVPGVGKSTFIEHLGKIIITEGKKLAVLTVDPSSKKNKGSILGDKTRMENLAKEKHVFIRPSPAGDTLGGVTNATRESIILLEATGYNVIFVETVGVGQSETAVYNMTDIFILLMLAGAGDELQGIKRGIMEMADIICINKADGGNIEKANHAKRDLKRAIHLFSASESGWNCIVETCSASHNINLEIIWEHVLAYEAHTKKNKYFSEKRKQQLLSWFREALQNNFMQVISANKQLQEKIIETEKLIFDNTIIPSVAAKNIVIDDLFNK